MPIQFFNEASIITIRGVVLTREEIEYLQIESYHVRIATVIQLHDFLV